MTDYKLKYTGEQVDNLLINASQITFNKLTYAKNAQYCVLPYDYNQQMYLLTPNTKGTLKIQVCKKASTEVDFDNDEVVLTIETGTSNKIGCINLLMNGGWLSIHTSWGVVGNYETAFKWSSYYVRLASELSYVNTNIYQLA